MNGMAKGNFSLVVTGRAGSLVVTFYLKAWKLKEYFI